MRIPLQNLIDYEDPFEPMVSHAPMERLMRQPTSDQEEVLTRARAVAALFSCGMEASLDDDEETVADQQFDMLTRDKPISVATLHQPGIILKLSALLSEYDYQVVQDAGQMRTYITNRLLEESDPKMPASQRLNALKLLGQMTDVALFTERTEVTVKTMSTENLEARLHDRLKTLLPEDVTVIENAT